MSVRRKAVSVTSEAWLPHSPQFTKLEKQVARFCHSILPIVFITLQGGSFNGRQSSMHFTEEDKSGCFYFISPVFVGYCLGACF